MWAIGIYDLYLPEEEFWHLTLAQFEALIRRHLLTQKQMDAHFALVCTILANIYRDPKEHEAFTIEDFMPGYEKEPPKKQTPKEMLEVIRIWNKMFGGKETRRESNV